MRIWIKITASVLCGICLAGCQATQNDLKTTYAEVSVPSVETTVIPNATLVPDETEPVETFIPTTYIPETEPEETQPAATQPVTDSRIRQIQDWYQQIRSDDNLDKDVYGDAATVFRKNGQIVSIAEYRQLNDAMDPAMATVHFYYHDGEPFFVYIEYDHYQYEELRLYFHKGELIRWIIDEQDPVDDTSHAEFQKYYAEAWDAKTKTRQPNTEEEPPATSAQPMTHEEKIQQIRDWYQQIKFDPDLRTMIYGDAATVYWQNGQIVGIDEYRQLNDAMDPAMATVHFYYHDGEPFFVFIEYENYEYEEVRIYYYKGNLIRWIVDDNQPADNIPHWDYQNYYTEALDALANAPR